MCLAVPVCMVEMINEDMAKVRVGEGETYMDICIMLLPEPPKVGEYMIVHAGFALRVLDPVEAEEALKLLRQVAEVGEVIEF